MNHWQRVQFKQVAEVITGNTPPKKDPENYGLGVPWVKPPDLDSWLPVTETEENLSEIGQKKARLLPTGTVMVCCIGSIGRVGIAGTTLATNQQINSLIFKKLIEPRFGYYYCRSIKKIFQAEARQAVVPILNKSNFEKIEMPLPPPSEQRRIVEILDQADALRRRRADADALAARILPALFLKMFGDPATNPKGWEIVKLGELAKEFRYGTSVKCESNRQGFPVLRIPNIVRGELDLTDLKYAELTPTEVSTLKLINDDVIFVRTNGNPEYVGRCSVFDKDEPMLFASYLIRARVKTNEINSWYLTSYLQSPSGRQAMSPVIRTTAGQSNINIEGLKQIAVPLPPLEIQTQFYGYITQLREVKLRARESEEKISKTFDSILHRAFSGELTAKWREAHLQELLEEMEEQHRELERVETQTARLF